MSLKKQLGLLFLWSFIGLNQSPLEAKKLLDKDNTASPSVKRLVDTSKSATKKSSQTLNITETSIKTEELNKNNIKALNQTKVLEEGKQSKTINDATKTKKELKKQEKPELDATQTKKEPKQEKLDAKSESTQPSTQTPLDKEVDLKSPDLFGTEKRLIKSDLKSTLFPFPNNKEITFLITEYLQAKSKKTNLLCPAGYYLQNNHSLYGELSFVDVYKGSCVGDEAKETYRFNKKWNLKKRDSTNLVESYNKIIAWMLELFFHPFSPTSFKTPPKEFKEAKLDQSCPSCSFSFKYNYKYTEDSFIDFNVKAICTDRKHTFSKIKQDNYVVNNWNCVKEKPFVETKKQTFKNKMI